MSADEKNGRSSTPAKGTRSSTRKHERPILRTDAPVPEGSAHLLSGDSGSVPPQEGVAELAEIFAIALSSIRSPLEDAVTRFGDIASSVPMGSTVADAVGRARRSVFEAKRVLDSLHLLARPPRDPAKVEAVTVVTPVVRAVKDVFTTGTIDVMEILAPGLPVALAEPLALRYLLLNLIVAAIRGCATTGIVRVIARPGEDGGLEIQIDDEGPAIVATDVESLFDPSTDERGRRAGLALHLSKRLAERAGADLEAVVRPHGASFVVSLPNA